CGPALPLRRRYRPVLVTAVPPAPEDSPLSPHAAPPLSDPAPTPTPPLPARPPRSPVRRWPGRSAAWPWPGRPCCSCSARARRRKSEEHTSELQSRENLVCRLLLEKKNARDRRQPGHVVH